jgi:CRP/FNR family transcriptional regulator, nitrogen fixation regulation protein
VVKTGLKNKKSQVRRRMRQSASAPSRSPIDRMGSTTLFSRGEKVFRNGQASRHIYQVESGCIRTFTNQSDGRRLILAFYFPGDYFGLEMRKTHRVSAEATTPSSVRLFGIKTLALRAATDGAVARHMMHITNVELQRAQNHSLLLRNYSDERVGNFLFEMKKRSRRKEVDLLMSRQDIADYLNLSLETVSRAFTRLENKSAISLLTPQRVAIHYRKPLAA